MSQQKKWRHSHYKFRVTDKCFENIEKAFQISYEHNSVSRSQKLSRNKLRNTIYKFCDVFLNTYCHILFDQNSCKIDTASLQV